MTRGDVSMTLPRFKQKREHEQGSWRDDAENCQHTQQCHRARIHACQKIKGADRSNMSAVGAGWKPEEQYRKGWMRMP